MDFAVKIKDMRKYRWILFLYLTLLVVQSGIAKDYVVTSPDKSLKTVVSINQGQMSYVLKRNGKVVIENSALGISYGNEVKLQVKDVERAYENNDWQPLWGANQTVKDEYNSMNLSLEDGGQQLILKVRLYNEGLAFKYVVKTPEFKGKKQIKEDTQFSVAKDASCWVLDHPWGKKYKTDVAVADVNNASLPLLCNTQDTYILITEAELYNYGSLHLTANPNGILCADIVGETILPERFETPWRVVMVANDPVYFVENNELVLNLNAPCKLEDTSWIKPGICTWDWRARGAVENGFEYSLNTETLIRFVEKTSALGIPYFMIDAGWYGKEHSAEANPMTVIPEIDMPKFFKEAKEKNVGVWLYVNRIAFDNFDVDEILSTYKEWGVVGIKLGFLKLMNQKGVELLQQILEKCAEYEIMFDCHEAVIPSGIERTWPHFFTREYNHSLADGRYIASPVDHTITPFLNNVAGPIDVTPAFFNLDGLESRTYVRAPLRSTVVAQTAMCVTYFSPLLCLADIPEAYERKSDLFNFIKELPLNYDESIVLNSQIGKQFIIARRKGDTWWIGGVANENGCKMSIKLDFLKKGDYQATIFSDGKETTWKINREMYEVSKKQISSSDKLNVMMRPGGGICIKLEKK
ncbi:hypothetical protein EYV94_15785 [Puteibacter caeruleilacunae]|nr:hypothetical protein EYV94_15785 [Puteibacter caeruleilacunae]